jgi:hypothetical protein
LQPNLIPLVDGTPSAGAVTAVSLVDSTSNTARKFTFQYLPDVAGGPARVSCGITGVAPWPVNVYGKWDFIQTQVALFINSHFSPWCCLHSET